NTIRLPYSNDVLLPGQLANGISGPLNPDLEGIAALDLLDKLVEGARERGLKIILDRHRPTAAAQSSLWYTKEVSEEVWIEDWRMLAERYRGNDTVIGVDLHNEPRESAAWGGGDPLTDWRLAAERAGTAIQEVNPYLLILVQGVERYHDDWYWWGGDLQGVRTDPVRLAVPNRVVYSPHDYGPGVYEQGWFQDPRFPANLPEVWDRRWGYIQREGIAPVVVGEFGGRLAGNPRERQWQQALINYLKAYQIGALNWALNPNSGDTGGILDGDWLSVVQDKQDIYAQLLAPPLDLGLSGAFGRAPTRLSLQFRQTETAQRAGNVGFVLRIANDGPDPLDLSRLEARYWFNADGASGSPQEVVIDWAEMGAEQVQAAIVPVLRDAQSAYLRLRFGAKAGAVPPYRTSGAVQVRLHRSDWTPYDQSNDYSFRSADAPPSGQMQPWDRVTLYRDGRLVWGIEP
ncbi:MAG: cellulase family glycosylhydrolase, partial [Chloroflexi bacterium]|nr:cellulase family glycosylhydrolase [Chloroflexota bacterium]